MHLVASLAALLGIELEAITERVRNTIIINAVMAVLTFVGLCFLLAAGFFVLADLYGAIFAALILAGVFLALALIVYLAGRIAQSRRRRIVVERRRSSEAGAFVTTAALTALPALLRSPAVRTIGLPAAAVAAFLLLRGGSRPRKD